MDADEIRNIETLKRHVAARVKDANRFALASQHTPSPKPFRPPPGHMPTLGQIARQGGGWVWLICPSQLCQHRVAAHLAIFVQQLGSEFPMDQFRARLWCTSCGCLHCSTHAPSWRGSDAETNEFPEQRGYYAHLEKLDREGAFLYVVVDRRTGKIRRDRLTAAQARNAASRYNARGGTFTTMHFEQYRLTIAQRSV
jgi:hypothetical protein